MIPLNDYIMVKPDELKDEETTTSGIILTQQTQEKPETGIVLDSNKSKVVAKGDRIYYKGYLMDMVEDTGFIKEEDILAKDESST